MDSLFTATTVVLTPEYAELFTSQELASKLSKVRSLTGIQFSKAKKPYALTGSWEQVNDAFQLLQKWLDNPSEEPRVQEPTENGDSVAATEGNSEAQQLAGPGAFGETESKTESNRPADLVKQAKEHRGNDHNENIEIGVEVITHKERKKRKAKLTKIKQEPNPIHDPINSQESPKKSKENKLKVKPQVSKPSKAVNSKPSKAVNKKGKNKVLSELTRSQQHKDTNSNPSVNGGLNCDINDENNSSSNPTDITESDNLADKISHDIKESCKENENGSPKSKSINCSKLKDGEKCDKRNTRKPGDAGYWSRVKIPDYNEKHKCTKCDVVLKSRKRYMEHLRRIHIKDFKCDVCERRFGYPTDLHRHKCPGLPDPNKEHKAKGGRPKKMKPKVQIFLPCPECEYIGTSKKRFNGHVRRTHRLKFPCDMCDKMFGFSRDLQRHKDNVHSEASYFCDKCSKFYKSKAVFELHIKTHEEGYVKPTFECQVCAKTFTTKYVLASHIKTEHLGMKKIYLCQICGKNFSQRNSYKQHSNAHAGIKPYKCDICEKAFTYHKSLKEHKFMHDNVRRFQCQLCEKAFRQRTTLQIHMKVHKTIKDHICPTCGKGFAQKQALERHERIHTGVKPYTCVPCQRTFGDASTIRRHMLAIHQKDETNWREDIICTIKKKTDYYVLGGSGQNRTYRSKSNPVQASKPVNKEEKKPVIQETPISEASLILLNTQDPCSLDYKSEYSLSDLASLQEQTGQLQTIQPGAIYAVSTSIPQSQHIQTQVNPLTVNYSTSGSHVLDFTTLPQTVSQPQVTGEREPEHCADQAQLDLQTSCSNVLHNSSMNPVTMVTESQRLAQQNGLQTTTTDASALNQTVGNIWGFVGYGAYYNAATLQQYQTTQNQQ